MRLFPKIRNTKNTKNTKNIIIQKENTVVSKKVKTSQKSSYKKSQNLLQKHLNTNILSQKTKNKNIYPSIRHFNVKLKQLTNDELKNLENTELKTNIYYTPSQLATVYGLNNGSLPVQRGLGIKVAVIIAYHYSRLQSDFNAYNTKYNLPRQTLQIKKYTSSSNSGWNEECCLDVQTIHSVAPYAQIMVVEAKSPTYDNLLTAIKYAVSNGANVVSMSWGGGESSNAISLYNSYFATVPNVCFVVSSGDSSNIVNFPSTSQNVISVGGTNITRKIDGTRNTEIPWYNNPNSAGGNGYSSYISKPNYQSSISAITGSKRCTPDISLIADPSTGFVVNYKGSYYIFGGTSLAAPVMAGMLAIANQIRKNNNKTLLSSTSLRNFNLQNYMYNTIYANNPIDNSIYTSPIPYTANMYDITVGENGIYNAGAGYDVASGLGSLNANIFCNTLNNI
jgi:subtilase family serine protease